MTEQQEQAVRELRQCYVYSEYASLFEQMISNLSQTQSAMEQAQARVAELEQSKRRFPIQRGPDVPWEVMAPHEAMAQKNHQQSLQRLAERGGLSGAEAWAVVNGLGWYPEPDWKVWEEKWRAFAERVNLHYVELEQAQRERDEVKASVYKELDKVNSDLLASEAARERHVKALQWFFKQLDDKTLVRNIDDDDKPGFHVRWIKFVSELQQAREALKETK